MRGTELIAMLGYRKGKKISEHRVFINLVDLARFLDEEKNKLVYVYVRKGKLYVSKDHVPNSMERRFLVHHAHGQAINVEIYLPLKIVNQIKKFNERNGRSQKYDINKWWNIKVVLMGFPKSAVHKHTRLESVIKAQKASMPVLERKYGKSWANKISKLGAIKQRKLRSLFENDMIKVTLEAGVPAAIFEPDIEKINGIPDLLLPNKILVEFAGYTRKESYIQKLIEKVNDIKDDHKLIIVAYNNKILNELTNNLRDVHVISRKEYVRWIEAYAQWLKTIIQKEFPSMPSLNKENRFQPVLKT